MRGVETLIFATENIGFATGWGNKIYKTTNARDTWVEEDAAWNELFIIDGAFYNNLIGTVISHTGNAYLTNDGGVTWTGPYDCGEAPQSVIYTNENTLYTVGIPETINKSTDGGITWTNIVKNGNDQESGDDKNYYIGIKNYGENHFIVTGENGDVVVTYDNFQTIHYVTNEYAAHIFKDALIHNEDSFMLIGTPEVVMTVTKDDILNNNPVWRIEWASFQESLYSIGKSNTNDIYVSGSGGFFMRRNPYNNVPSSIENIKVATEIVAFPNPVTDYLQVHLKNVKNIEGAYLVTLDNKMLEIGYSKISPNRIMMNVTKFSAGNYQLVIQTDNGPITTSIVIQ